MNRSEPAALCYAEALVLLAKERKRLPEVVEDLRAVEGVFRADATLRGLFTTPRVTREKKEEMVRRAFDGRIGPEVAGLLVVMIRKGRETLLDNVVGQFERFMDLEHKRIHVHLDAAKAVDPAVRAALEKAVAEASGKTVVLHERTDPSLLAGLVVRVGDLLVDGSLRTRLRRLGARLAGDPG